MVDYRHFSILCLVMSYVAILAQAGYGRSSNGIIREKRTAQRQGLNHNRLSDLRRQIRRNGGLVGNFSNYTPTTPRPEDVNCHVEVPTTTLVGGRCINLGNANFPRMVCRAGAFVAFTSDCHNMIPGANMAAAVSRGTGRRTRGRGHLRRRRPWVQRHVQN